MAIDELISCTKIIERKRKPSFKEDFRHYKMNIQLSCPDTNAKMTMFLRRSKDFSEDFSVGLKLDGPNEIMEYDIILIRYQGPHGGQSGTQTIADLHNSYHIHEYTEDDFIHRRKRASYKCDGKHTSFEEAIILFMERCNIADPNGIFDDEREKIMQIRLDFDNLHEEGGITDDNE